MAILRTKEIAKMSSDERTKKLGELRAELARLRTMISAGGAIENPTRVRELRKTIAQLLTIEHEQKLGIRIDEKSTESKKSKSKKSKTNKKKSEEKKSE
jgi:large subunit ribosomal protein L29